MSGGTCRKTLQTSSNQHHIVKKQLQAKAHGAFRYLLETFSKFRFFSLMKTWRRSPHKESARTHRRRKELITEAVTRDKFTSSKYLSLPPKINRHEVATQQNVPSIITPSRNGRPVARAALGK